MHIWKIDRALRKHLEVRLPMWKKSNLKNKKALQLMLQKYKRSLESIMKRCNSIHSITRKKWKICLCKSESSHEETENMNITRNKTDSIIKRSLLIKSSVPDVCILPNM
jgi:hypothetical protein